MHVAVWLQPVRLGGEERGVGRGTCVHFASVDGEINVVPAAVSRKNLDVQFHYVAQQLCRLRVRRALSGDSDHHVRTTLATDVVKRSCLRVLSRHENKRVVRAARGGAQPSEFHRIELNVRIAFHHGHQRQAAIYDSKHSAVAWCPDVDKISRNQACSAWHVLDDERRIAGNMLAHVACEQARVNVVATAGAVPDENLDLLSLIKIRDRICPCVCCQQRSPCNG